MTKSTARQVDQVAKEPCNKPYTPFTSAGKGRERGTLLGFPQVLTSNAAKAVGIQL